jgi:hypothetical protein
VTFKMAAAMDWSNGKLCKGQQLMDPNAGGLQEAHGCGGEFLLRDFEQL